MRRFMVLTGLEIMLLLDWGANYSLFVQQDSMILCWLLLINPSLVRDTGCEEMRRSVPTLPRYSREDYLTMAIFT